MNIGDRIRAARKAAQLSQEEVARRAGLSLKGMGEIERGDIEDPHVSSLTKIARALGVSVEALLKEEEPVPAGKAEAPEAGRAEQPIDEEERRVVPQSAESLRRFIRLMKSLKEERAAEMTEVSSGATHPGDTWLFRMEAEDSYLRELLEEAGALGFAEEVKACRELADPAVASLCHELLRHLAELASLTEEARALSAAADSGVHVEVEKGVPKLESLAKESERPGR